MGAIFRKNKEGLIFDTRSSPYRKDDQEEQDEASEYLSLWARSFVREVTLKTGKAHIMDDQQWEVVSAAGVAAAYKKEEDCPYALMVLTVTLVEDYE